jgi:hypothetical protein
MERRRCIVESRTYSVDGVTAGSLQWMRLGRMGKPFVVIRFAGLSIMREQARLVNVNQRYPVSVLNPRTNVETSVNVEYGLVSIPVPFIPV